MFTKVTHNLCVQMELWEGLPKRETRGAQARTVNPGGTGRTGPPLFLRNSKIPWLIPAKIESLIEPILLFDIGIHV